MRHCAVRKAKAKKTRQPCSAISQPSTGMEGGWSQGSATRMEGKGEKENWVGGRGGRWAAGGRQRQEGERSPGRTRVEYETASPPPTPWCDRWLNLSCAVTRVMTHGVCSWQPFRNFITTRTQTRLWPKSAPAPSPPDNNHLTSTCKYPVTDS